MRYTEHQGYPWASWGIHRQGMPTGTWASFLVESVIQLVGSASLWCPLSGGCYSLRLTSCLRVVQHTSVFCMWKKEVGVFGRVLCSWGSQLPIHIVSFLQRRNHGLRKFFLALSCATLGEGWQRSSEIVLFSLFNMPNIGFFFPSGVLEFLCWTTRLL